MFEKDNAGVIRSKKMIRIGLPKGNVYEKSKQFVANIIGQKVPRVGWQLNMIAIFFTF